MKNALVKIFQADGKMAGTGFLTSEDGIILTASHVVLSRRAQQSNKPIPIKVKIEFYSQTLKNGASTVQFATVLQDYWLPFSQGDVAVLKFEGNIPKSSCALPLGSSENKTLKDEIHVLGFPDGQTDTAARGTLLNRKRDRSLQFEVLQIDSKQIEGGFSGAPAWNIDTGLVIGFVSWKESRDKSFIIPSEEIVKVYSDLHIVQQLDIVERLEALSGEEERILLVCSEPDVFEDFRIQLVEKRFDDFLHLIHLKKEDLQVLSRKKIFAKNTRPAHHPPPNAFIPLMDLKILTICSGIESAMPHEQFFHRVFNNEQLFSENGNPAFRIAYYKGLDVKGLLRGELQKTYNPKFTFPYEDLSNLFESNDFLNFLAKHELYFRERETYTYGLQCPPTKNKVNVKPNDKYIHAFVFRGEEEKFIYFIINYVRYFFSITTPNFIIDSAQGIDMYQTFTDRLKEVSNNRFANFVKPEYDLLSLIDRKRKGLDENESYMFVFKNLEADKTPEIQQVIRLFQQTELMIKNPSCNQPSFVFFILHKDFNISEDENQFLIPLPPPNAIDQTTMETWKDHCTIHQPLKTRMVFDRLIKRFTKQFAGSNNALDIQAHPAKVIQFVCQEFSIPYKQILNIS